jgi:hypothetical protein
VAAVGVMAAVHQALEERVAQDFKVVVEAVVEPL